jgi:adenosylhomocysteine nucleosidase
MPRPAPAFAAVRPTNDPSLSGPVRLGLLTGIAAEARIAACCCSLIGCSGGSPARARTEAERLVAEGATHLVSFGIAGGLDATLESGALIVPDAVLASGTRRYPTDKIWRERLLAALPDASCGTLYGSDTIIESCAEKRALYLETGARAVDLESHAVASVAERRQLPFIVFRAISDPAGRHLPHAVRVGLKPDGSAAIGSVLLDLARRPGQLPSLIRTAYDAATALNSLRLLIDTLTKTAPLAS